MKAMKKHFLFMLPVASLLAAALLSSCSSSDDDVTGGTDPVKPEPALDHAVVDLGLPSGTLWATMNVGATSPEGYGDYFAWGETEPYYNGDSQSPLTWKTGKTAGYNWASYTKFGTFDSSAKPDYGFTKYNTTNGPTILESADDAATANWGSAWRMPTREEWHELVENYPLGTSTPSGKLGYCKWTYNYNNTDIIGLAFYKGSDTSAIVLFLPAAGCRYDTSMMGQRAYGGYWSGGLFKDSSDHALILYFESGYVSANCISNARCNGYSVRPVVAQ